MLDFCKSNDVSLLYPRSKLFKYPRCKSLVLKCTIWLLPKFSVKRLVACSNNLLGKSAISLFDKIKLSRVFALLNAFGSMTLIEQYSQ